MKELARIGFVCTGENALELSGAICCAGRLMRFFNDNGYMTGGCYSCISPSKQTAVLRERICNMCDCNDVVIAVGCNGFKKSDVMPEIIQSISPRELSHFSNRLSNDEYTDAETGISHKCFPSRSIAVICNSSLILSVDAEPHSVLGKLASLLSGIRYVVGNFSDKQPSQMHEMSDLMADFYMQRNFQ